MVEPSQVRVIGPLASQAEGFCEFLVDRGYSPTRRLAHVRLMAEVSRWLAARDLGATDLDPERVVRLAARRRRQGRDLCSPRSLRPLLSFLEGRGLSPTGFGTTPMAVLLTEYHQYLVAERSLAASTVCAYMHTARWFLAEMAGDGRRVAELSAADVTRFLRRRVPGRSPRTVNEVGIELRCLLRFLYVKDRIDRPLAEAVLGMASWRGGALPRAVPAGTGAKLLASCDPGTLVGCRDRAMVGLVVRLGLRASEVAAIELGDIDWRAGELVVRGKGGTRDALPLPAELGEAIAVYLQRRGPNRGTRQVFVHVHAAPRPGVTMTDVRAAVRRACWRAGLDDTGTHRFRHRVATDMLAAGAPLYEIGQVLRHRDVETTSLYAKVDRAALADVTQPWPGSHR